MERCEKLMVGLVAVDLGHEPGSAIEALEYLEVKLGASASQPSEMVEQGYVHSSDDQPWILDPFKYDTLPVVEEGETRPPNYSAIDATLRFEGDETQEWFPDLVSYV